MATNVKSAYRHILSKLSGETLQSTGGLGIDISILDRMAQEIKELVELSVQVGVVIGRDNLFRGAGPTKAGMGYVMGDHMGILVIVINDLVVRDVLYRVYVDVCLVFVIPLNGVYNGYGQTEATSLLYNNCAVILSTGADNPLFTIDSAACLRGVETETDIVLKATKVDGVLTVDPTKDPTATTYEQLTYSGVLEKESKVMDLAVFMLARDHRLPIRVFSMNRPGALCRVAVGEEEGILITE